MRDLWEQIPPGILQATRRDGTRRRWMSAAAECCLATNNRQCDQRSQAEPRLPNVFQTMGISWEPFCCELAAVSLANCRLPLIKFDPCCLLWKVSERLACRFIAYFIGSVLGSRPACNKSATGSPIGFPIPYFNDISSTSRGTPEITLILLPLQHPLLLRRPPSNSLLGHPSSR